jgi:TetR/AcrR family transcriptional regulator, transcriptional repressor for nem operon
MPRVSREQAESHRATIMDAASRLFREHGIKGVSVAELMGAAGLTHGGFYGHFDSKDSLAAEACRFAFERSVNRWKKRVEESETPAAAREMLVDNYLSAKARGNPGNACPASCLAGDVAREPTDSLVHDVFVSGVEELIRILAGLQRTGDAALDRRQALADLSAMAGALMLARATSGREISNEILAAVRERLIF